MAKAPIARVRHLRHRRLDGIDRGYLRHLIAWLAAQVTQLNVGKAASTQFVASDVTDDLSAASHGFSDGDGPFRLTTDNTLPAPLAIATDYWVGGTTVSTFKVYTTRALALASAPSTHIDLTDSGTGVNHRYERADADSDNVLQLLREGIRPQTIEASDVDDFSFDT